jgi:hypothetical protein
MDTSKINNTLGEAEAHHKRALGRLAGHSKGIYTESLFATYRIEVAKVLAMIELGRTLDDILNALRARS